MYQLCPSVNGIIRQFKIEDLISFRIYATGNWDRINQSWISGQPLSDNFQNSNNFATYLWTSTNGIWTWLNINISMSKINKYKDIAKWNYLDIYFICSGTSVRPSTNPALLTIQTDNVMNSNTKNIFGDSNKYVNGSTVSVWNYTNNDNIIFDNAKKDNNNILADNNNKLVYRIRFPYSYIFKNYLTFNMQDSADGASYLSICDIVLS